MKKITEELYNKGKVTLVASDAEGNEIARETFEPTANYALNFVEYDIRQFCANYDIVTIARQ